MEKVNIFREAKQLLQKDGQLTDEDWKVIGAAMIPLNHPACPFPEDMTIANCLEELARIVEGTKTRVPGKTRTPAPPEEVVHG